MVLKQHWSTLTTNKGAQKRKQSAINVLVQSFRHFFLLNPFRRPSGSADPSRQSLVMTEESYRLCGNLRQEESFSKTYEVFDLTMIGTINSIKEVKLGYFKH
jgi:hypothetical protein